MLFSQLAIRPILIGVYILTDTFLSVTFLLAVPLAHGQASSCSNINFTECFVHPCERPKYSLYIPPTTDATSPSLVSVATTMSWSSCSEAKINFCYSRSFFVCLAINFHVKSPFPFFHFLVGITLPAQAGIALPSLLG
jgi:hypothetical protein